MSRSNPMRTERKTSVKNSAGRLVTSAVFLLLQVGWIILALMKFYREYVWISLVTIFIGVIIALKIYGTSTNSAMKMPWIIVILTLPILGLLIYLLFGRSIVTRTVKLRFEKTENVYREALKRDESLIPKIRECDYGIANQFRYLENHVGYPVYQNTDIVFYDDALDGFNAQIEELKKAEHFIFMEYHAIEDAESFNRIKEILIEKAQNGVEVRLFYDDMGSIFFLNKDFIKQMRKNGIDCKVFNPISMAFNMFMNNRDHRKITVVDGRVAFTGGYNLANEYFNITSPYGEWKDTGIMLTGDAVKGMTALFLSMWNSLRRKETNEAGFEQYLNATDNVKYIASNSHYVAPYGDNPLGSERVGENVYLNFIKNAKKYIYITTPYLLITDEMSRELSLAAKRGIDVRIVTPGIPDKKFTYRLTRSYYAELVKNGIRIYEFTPGFMHAKQWVSDDEMSIVGTINMDFRSLYLHFENAVLVYGYENAVNVRKDFENIFNLSNEVTKKYSVSQYRKRTVLECILRLLAPLF